MADKTTADLETTKSDMQSAHGEDQNPPLEETVATPDDKTVHVGFIRQDELLALVRAYDPNVSENILNEAYDFAMEAHGGQMRQSGEPYFSHPLAVAAILTELRADPATVITALLHDVVEDTSYTVADIYDKFGSEIASAGRWGHQTIADRIAG